MPIRTLILAALALSTASVAYAASTPLYDRKMVTSEAARTIVDTCVAMARGGPVPAAVAVVDPYGVLIDFHSMQGAGESTGTTAILKAKTAARWRRSSADVNQRVITGQNRAPEWIGDFPQPGALPIVIDGQVVGAVGVGGGNNDEACARAGIEAVFGKNAAPPPVTPLPATARQ
jgi:glc operon protein GlcG